MASWKGLCPRTLRPPSRTEGSRHLRGEAQISLLSHCLSWSLENLNGERGDEETPSQAAFCSGDIEALARPCPRQRAHGCHSEDLTTSEASSLRFEWTNGTPSPSPKVHLSYDPATPAPGTRTLETCARHTGGAHQNGLRVGGVHKWPCTHK